MNHNRNYKPRHLMRRKRNNRHKAHVLLLSLLLITAVTVVGTLAFLSHEIKPCGQYI